ncbi:MAG TPA: MOSC domain-containing protein [Candidatus Sulfotelmatobacter sp.]|nr:MOSC domain-containing protein [Candidatus Sulfotelmatobacter sp.]
MKVLSVNVGMPREVIWNGTPVLTGIFKEPVRGPVRVNRLNLAGDRQADLTVHGGPAKAVYGYPVEHYEYWQRELPEIRLFWGIFGENLTTEGLSEENLCIGDRLKIGSAVLAVTQPRMPCYKLELKFGRGDMIKRFAESGRSGFYFSVIKAGEVSAGSEVEIVSRDANQVTIAELNDLLLGRKHDPGLIQRTLNVDVLPDYWRANLVQRLEMKFTADA